MNEKKLEDEMLRVSSEIIALNANVELLNARVNELSSIVAAAIRRDEANAASIAKDEDYEMWKEVYGEWQG